MAVSDGRGDEVVRERLEELLEDGASETERRELDELLRGSEEARTEWERLRRLDALLEEAIPEPWTAARTDRVLTALGVEESREGVRARWITGPLTVLAAAVALFLWGGPLTTLVPRVPELLRDGAGGLLAAVGAPAKLGVPLPAAALIGVSILVVGAVGGRLAARRLESEVDHA
jgi:anti-sigma factor RsiW